MSAELDWLNAIEGEDGKPVFTSDEADELLASLSEEDKGVVKTLADETKPKGEKKVEAKTEEVETTEETVETDELPGLTSEAKLRLQTRTAPAKKEDPKPFDAKEFVKLLETDVQAAWDYVEPHTQAGKKRGELEDTLKNVQFQQQADAAERFFEKNPDYPFENKEVNDFLAGALLKFGLPWTPGNLGKVWKQMKDEGLAKGKKVVAAKAEVSETVETKAAPVRSAPIAPARQKTGGIQKTGGGKDFFSKLNKVIDETKDIDELERQLMRKGFGDEGSLSRLIRN